METIEGEVVEGTATTTAQPTNGAALAVRKESQAQVWVPDFAVSVDAMVARVEAKHDFFKRVMKKGQHYGPLPGVKAKDGEPEKWVLFKPGAELLLASMGLYVELSDASPPVERTGRDGEEGEYSYRRRCRIYRQTGPLETDRMMVAQAEGSCTSFETKYRWRDTKRTCPACGVSAVIAGKAEYGGGWLCFKKQNGCGAKFKYDDPAISGQVIWRIPNPDLADVANTILKMADKRAMVAATLVATGCSDIFAQDLEEAEGYAPGGDDAPPPAGQAAPAAAPPTKAASNPVQDALAAKELRKMIGLKWQGVEEAARHEILQRECKTTDLKAVPLERLRGFLAMSDMLIAEVRNRPAAPVSEPVAASEPPPAQEPAPEPEPPAPPRETGQMTGLGWPPPSDGVPMTAKTRARLFALLSELGIEKKNDRIGWAESFGIGEGHLLAGGVHGGGKELTSYAQLPESVANWLVGQAAQAVDEIRRASA